MGILEERKAFEDGFERLQRIYKEWQRNPSALVRDSLKKYLIDCYDHLLKLDRIDIDAGKFEESIISASNKAMADPQIDQIENSKVEVKVEEIVAEEPESINIVLNEEEEIVEELPEVEEIEEEIAAEEQTEEMVEEESLEEVIEETVEEIVSEEATESEELDPSEVYLSGSEEREIEEYFKSNFPQSEIDENEVRKVEEEPIAETTIEYKVVAEEETVAQEEVEEELEVEAEVTAVESTEILEEEVEEEPEVESKSRWSSFFSKDEPKPYKEVVAGEQTQLTLADKLAVTKEEGVHYEMKEQAITDLNGAIPIAKKFEFIRELFGDDSTNYKTAVASINEAGEIQKALDISENLAETYNWSSKEKIAEEFNTFVKRRFSA